MLLVSRKTARGHPPSQTSGTRKKRPNKTKHSPALKELAVYLALKLIWSPRCFQFKLQ